jgi:hypothetical protein
MIPVALPAQANAPTLEYSLLNVEQGISPSISMEFKTQGGPAQFKVKIFQRKGLFTSHNEMLSFEQKNSVVLQIVMSLRAFESQLNHPGRTWGLRDMLHK